MEQAPSLTMNINSGASTPRLDPIAQVPDTKSDAGVEKEVDADASSLASTSTITPDTPPKDGATIAKETVSDGEGKGNEIKTEAQTARERAFQHGLDKNNFETEVHQVMGTLNSWWGGVKKQVSGDHFSLQLIVD